VTVSGSRAIKYVPLNATEWTDMNTCSLLTQIFCCTVQCLVGTEVSKQETYNTERLPIQMKEEIKKEMPIPISFPHIKDEYHEETTNEDRDDQETGMSPCLLRCEEFMNKQILNS